MFFLGKILGGEVPIQQLRQHGLQVAGPLVLIVEVIGVLPDIDGEQAIDALGHRAFGVRRAHDRKLAAGRHQPGPARSELRLAGLGERLAQFRHRAEVAFDGVGQIALRRGGFGRQAAPVEIVVPHLAGVVEDLLGGGVGGRLVDDLFQLQRRVWRAFHQPVQRIHIGLVMLVIVKRNGAGADRGFEGVVGPG